MRTHAAFVNLIAGKDSGRRRKRGPRSALARCRRRKSRFGGAPADATPGESGVNASAPIDSIISQSFVLYCINIRCLLSNLAELCHQVKEHSPHVILLQETWLNGSVEEVTIPNYIVVSRRDRSDHENRGGIITYARLDVCNIVCVSKSSDAERAWHFLHLDIGTVAICNWYRPGSGGTPHIASIEKEITEYKEEVIGMIIMGDCNVHHRKWLRFSNANTSDGDLLQRICDEHAIKQCVSTPTRGDYLLDLVLTDLDQCKTEVIAPVADHRGILAKIALPSPKELKITREVWHFKGAAWSNLRCALKSCSWNRLFHGSVDSAVNHFLDTLIAQCEDYIPCGKLILAKSTTREWISLAKPL